MHRISTAINGAPSSELQRCRVFVGCAHNRFNKLDHHIFIIALVESINHDNIIVSPHRPFVPPVCTRPYDRFGHELLKLIGEGLPSDVWLAFDGGVGSMF
jgi:hypothetical protein